MRRILKKVLLVIMIIAIIGIIFFCIDYKRVQKQQLPLFCIKIITYLDGGTQVYLGMGYKVIDFNTLGGYDEIKIGTWFMDIDDFNDESKRYKVVPTPYPTQNKVYVRE